MYIDLLQSLLPARMLKMSTFLAHREEVSCRAYCPSRLKCQCVEGEIKIQLSPVKMCLSAYNFFHMKYVWDVLPVAQ